jgi:hypothetical protein
VPGCLQITQALASGMQRCFTKMLPRLKADALNVWQVVRDYPVLRGLCLEAKSRKRPMMTQALPGLPRSSNVILTLHPPENTAV